MMTQPSQVTTVTLLLQFNQSKLPDDLKNTISLDCLFVVGLANESEREREYSKRERERQKYASCFMQLMAEELQEDCGRPHTQSYIWAGNIKVEEFRTGIEADMKQAMADIGSIRGEGALTSPQPHDITKIPQYHIPNHGMCRPQWHYSFFYLNKEPVYTGGAWLARAKVSILIIAGDCWRMVNSMKGEGQWRGYLSSLIAGSPSLSAELEGCQHCQWCHGHPHEVWWTK